MKKYLLIVLLVGVWSCEEKDEDILSDNSIGENVSILVHPNQTDANYSTTNKSHFIVRNTKNHLNKLMLFIGGSFSSPDDYTFISEHAASIGFDDNLVSFISKEWKYLVKIFIIKLLFFDKWRI
mgnify:CR=1 FL=1